MDRMQAVVMRRTGGPEVLEPDRVPVPVAGPGQVLVRTEAIGVSPGETLMRSGRYPLPAEPPVVIGAEAAGTVEEVGEGVDPALLGRRVTAVTGGLGSYAEFVAVDATKAALVPDGLGAVEAVAAAAAGAVALGLIHWAGLRGAETVLVAPGSGKVGGYLIRHAREFGAARVVATAGRPGSKARLTELGAEIVVDHGDPDWPDVLAARLGRATVDIAFDGVGGQASGRLLGLLTPGTGRTLLYGAAGGSLAALDAGKVMGLGLRVIGAGGPVWADDVFGTHLPEFLRIAGRGGTHQLHVDATLPLARAADAHRRIEEGARRVILLPGA